MTAQIETLLPWSEPKRVDTRNGSRNLRTAPADEKFWKLWRENKPALKAAGISASKGKDGVWKVCWWLPLEPELVKAEQEKKAVRLEASRSNNADIDIPAPGGLAYLGYQKAGIKFCLDLFTSRPGVLIADEMGLGKTIQAIGIVNANPAINKVLIVCPATLKVNWKREFVKWRIRPLKVGIQNAGQPWIGELADVVIINYDIMAKFEKQLTATAWDLKVMDEAHYYKNPKAVRTKATLGVKSRFRAALTGTPILNRPIELHTILKDLDPVTWGNWWKYAERYCAAKRTQWGVDASGASNLDELQIKLRSTIMVRRLKKDVLTELPAKRRQIVELNPEGCAEAIAQEQGYFDSRQKTIRMLRAAVELAKASDDRAEYEGAVGKLSEGQGALFAEMAKLRHETVMRKLPQVMNFLADTLEGNGKLIAFGHHLDAIAALKAEFPLAAVVTGGMTSEEKMAQVDRFQTDPACTLFIGNDAAKEGLTLTAAAHVVFFELDWVPGNLSQKEDRAHRIGQKDSVLVTHLVLEGSLDATMAKRLIEKQEVIDSALDTGAEAFVEETESAKPAAKSVELAEPQTRSATFEAVAKAAESVTPEQSATALAGLKRLAAMDPDNAQEINGFGFSKLDGAIGHSLASRSSLTPKQTVLAIRILKKYHLQIPKDASI